MYCLSRKCVSRLRQLRSISSFNYDVIVVGGGHAGVEAATAASRMNCNTLLVTHKLQTIGEMSCNPAFGGIGKGQLMREIDALDGVCARICDLSGIQYKILNRSRGPAVWGPRAQIDRSLYKNHIQNELFNNTPNLTIKTCSIEDLILSERGGRLTCNGIITSEGQRITSRTTVISTGTFLRGQINIGLDYYPAGRIGDEPAIGLANTLEKTGFKMGRLKTGTPPRIDGRTIDYTNLSYTGGDSPPQPFSFLNDKVWIKESDQIKTHLTYTNDEVSKLISENMHLSRHVREEIRGPRYCPSIESKVLRFKDRNHQIWLEPEGLDTHVIYPNGISCTLPAEIQQKVIHLIPGLENAKMLRPGYGVEYDFVDPRQLKASLETFKIDNLFLSGQINGTTGYEEAAAQGIIAGINAAAKCLDREPLLISRTEGYIGVLIDDLTSLGTNEPYRMFTSRAEFRLLLRPDNADLRLTQKGHEIGCVSEKRYQKFCHTKKVLEESEKFLNSVFKSVIRWKRELNFESETKNSAVITGFQMLAVDNCSVEQMAKLFPEELNSVNSDPILSSRLKIKAFYERVVSEQQEIVDEVKREEMLQISDDIDYYNEKLGLSDEIKHLLSEHRPSTIGAATRIPGVTPVAIVRILYYMKRLHKQIENEEIVL